MGNRKYWLKVFAFANEDQKRRFAAAMALDLGWGGISAVSNFTGMSITTIRKGIRELQENDDIKETNRIRKVGGGRKKIEGKNPKILMDLEKLMDENTMGDPMKVLKWTIKSTYQLAKELNKHGYKVNRKTIARILKEQDYSLQANMKTLESGSDQDRDAQFKYINQQIKQFFKQRNPVISVDTKKRENVGNFKNNGRTWKKKGEPDKVNVYDFLSLGIGIAIPYGAYDIQRNEGFVNVGISYDTSEFAVKSIRQWWNLMGKEAYLNASRLLICCDGGGSNGSRRKGWKYYLQEFADEISIPISICHLPPGTSKWNKIEHRMFSFISINWKGKPLVDYQTIINLINNTTTEKGLTIVASLDKTIYKKGKKFTDEDMTKIQLMPCDIHPKWNYTILPRNC